MSANADIGCRPHLSSGAPPTRGTREIRPETKSKPLLTQVLVVNLLLVAYLVAPGVQNPRGWRRARRASLIARNRARVFRRLDSVSSPSCRMRIRS